MAKKDFKANPALAFFSAESVEAVDKEDTATPPTGGKKTQERPLPAPKRAEAKSKRAQILIQPSLYEAVKDKATADGISFNEAVTIALQKYIKRR